MISDKELATKLWVVETIRGAIQEERKRIAQILRNAKIEYDWDSVGGSKPDFSMTMVALAEEIENSPIGDP